MAGPCSSRVGSARLSVGIGVSFGFLLQTSDLEVLGNVKEPLDLTLRQGDLAVVDKVKDLPNLHLGHVLRHQEHWVSCCCGGERGEEAPEVGRHSAEDHL